MLTVEDIARTIDHAILQPNATRETLRAGLELARAYGVYSAIVRPCDLRYARAFLEGSDTKASTVVDFPHGAGGLAAKRALAQAALEEGSAELDMVIAVGLLLSGEYDAVEAEIEAVCSLAHAQGVPVKVIFENPYLDEDAKKAACHICTRVGVDFVKTATGFAGGGATLADVRLMRELCPPRVGVKAAGGIRNLDALLSALRAGCTRIGTSGTAQLLEEAKARFAAGTLCLPETPSEFGQGY